MQIPRYGSGATRYVATEEREDGQRVALTLAEPGNVAHGDGVPIYEVMADTWEEALAIHKQLNGFE